jgi:hypothetical protein
MLACSTWALANDAWHYEVRLLSLSGLTSAVTSRHCLIGSDPLVFRDEALWVTGGRKGCTPDIRITTLTADGFVKNSRPGPYAKFARPNHDIVVAFHKLVVASHTHRTLFVLRSADAKPAVLIHTR